MSRREHLKDILAQAEEKEKKYEWMKAADIYERALRAAGKKDFLRNGGIQEKIGHCFHRGAFQAESQEEFKKRMRQAIEAFDKARGFYEKTADEKKDAWMFRCEALTKYLGYWLTSDPSEKRKLLDECLELEGKVLAAFSESGDMLAYGKMFSKLPLVFWLRASLK